jgi:hypothetical protein
MQTIGESFSHSMNSTTGPILRFQYHNVMAAISEFESGAQPSESCPNHDDPLRLGHSIRQLCGQGP